MELRLHEDWKPVEASVPSTSKATRKEPSSSGIAACLKKLPSFSNPKVYDRYFGLAEFHQHEQNVTIEVPTRFHAGKIESMLPSLHESFSDLNFSVQVKARKPSDKDLEGPLKLRNANPQHHAAKEAASQLGMPVVSAPTLDSERLEQAKRLSSPELINAPSNAVLLQMAEQWATRVNHGERGQCLWLYGQGGSGKTQVARQMHTWISCKKRLRHIDVNSFFQEWRRALNEKTVMDFNRKYRRDTDVLILENLDELQGKTKTQEEVLITITALLDRGANIVVTSSETPLMIRELLPEALFSRLFSGLCFEMPKPDRHFREKLWRQMLKQNGLSDWTIDIRVTERVLSLELDTPRKLHSYYINLVGRLSLTQKLSMEDLLEQEAVHSPRQSPMSDNAFVSPGKLIDDITRLCGVSRNALQGTSRRKNITLARRFVCLGLSRFLGLTNVTIAQHIEKDPSTVSHALSAIEKELNSERHVNQMWNWICDELGMNPSFN